LSDGGGAAQHTHASAARGADAPIHINRMVAAFLLVAAVLLVHLAVLPHGFRLARTTTGGRVRRRFAVTSSPPPPPQPAATSTRAPPPPPHVPDPLVMKQVALLVAMWGKIAFPTEDDQETNFRLGDYGLDRNSVKGFLQHFQTCKDCAADNAFLMAAQDEADGADMLRLSNVYFPMCVEKDSDDEWGLFDPDLLGENGGTGENERTIFPVENDDVIVLADTKEWVRKVRFQGCCRSDAVAIQSRFTIPRSSCCR